MSRRRGLSAWLATTLLMAAVAATAQPIDSGFEGLVAQDGKPVNEASLAGRYRLVAFGYLHCPDVCPLTLQAMKLSLNELGAEAARLQAVFITVDPERDTPAQLAPYVRYFDSRILGLSGTAEATKRIADRYGIAYEIDERSAPDRYLVSHTTRLLLVAADGRVIARIAAGQPPQQIAAGVARLLRADPQWHKAQPNS